MKTRLQSIRKMGYSGLLVAVLAVTGCSAIGKIENVPVSTLPAGEQRYTIENYTRQHPVGETILVLAFSGGGTRAAALSYGVLEELRDTHFHEGGRQVRLLDEVDRISSVSGGSFTAAYYGLFGEQIFTDFKDVFLYKDVQGELKRRVFSLSGLLSGIFSSTSRTEKAINYYDKHIFHGKTFADLHKSGGPFIIINASDLNAQHQFMFVQAQFDFLCSDLSQFKIARAVAASSAVPILFPPILIEKYHDCHYQKPDWLKEAEQIATTTNDKRLYEASKSLNFYLDEKNPPYVTLLDGGITDNLGLRAILNSASLSGGAKKIFNRLYRNNPPKRMVAIVVNASTTTKTGIGESTKLPSFGDILGAVTDMQLHLYNTETNSLLKQSLVRWAEALSTEGHPIEPYFIELDVSTIKAPEDRKYINQIPTSFSLEQEQADKLIETAKILLRQNPEYQKLLQQLNVNPVTNRPLKP